MSIERIAAQYIDFVKASKYDELLNTLYAQDAQSIEPRDNPGGPRVTSGLEAILQKSKAFDQVHEMHSHSVEGPWPHGEDRFAVRLSFDMTHLPSGYRRQVDEIAVMIVRDGKIVREEFFYPE